VTAQLLDGKLLAQTLRQRLRAARQALGEREVRLVSVEVGQNPAADVYVRNQMRAAKEVGIEMEVSNLPLGTDEQQLVLAIQALNRRPEVAGVIVQRPLPPCTAAAAQHLIVSTGIDLRGTETVVVGHSEIVGKPIAVLLLHHLSTVTVCHVGTRKLVDHTRRADILVVAVGKAGLVHGDMVKPGAVVIDVGINQGADGRITGDVHFASTVEVAGHLTPVPGGVGPVTVAMLLRNTLRAAGATV
jgi:methylenetetrahydrofolate dehydrogenase (NADP+)/methenyltetrahydrofolate cyclohydrolase